MPELLEAVSIGLGAKLSKILVIPTHSVIFTSVKMTGSMKAQSPTLVTLSYGAGRGEKSEKNKKGSDPPNIPSPLRS